MGMLNTVSGLGKTGLATLAYPFAAIGTGVRAGVADMVGAPRPTDTAADAVAAFGASGVDDLKASYNEGVAGLKKAAAGVFGLTPSAPPTVVGQTPAAPAAAPAPAPNSVDALLNKTATTIANTPIDQTPAVPANKYDDVVAAAAAKGAQNSFTDFNTPGVTRAGAIQQPTAPVAPAVKPPTMNATIMEQQQNLMAQIAAAQQVVQQGSNRNGYKMGDVTKGLATMQALAPLVASSNNLMASAYGTDAGILTHSMDNTARVGIADAGNATEMAKAGLAANTALQGHQITAAGNMALAERKAALEAASPQGQAQLAEAATKARILKDTESLTGVSRAMATQGKYNIDQVKDGTTSNMIGAFVNGVYVPAATLGVQSQPPTTKKK